ncbi:MAG: D-alanyl-D-alanine carboxypeptidase family protein [Desulfovibrionaceae bacterium]|nr:D-alanyl-D-alanine carboxypeptidase family protein [Desulfovibrionaceae bacterium]
MNRRRFLATCACAAASTVLGPVLAPADAAAGLALFLAPQPGLCDGHIRDYLEKMHHFDERHADDVYLADADRPVFASALRRLQRLQRVVGFGNFYLIGFDEAVRFAERSAAVEPFTRRELDFMDRVFHEDAARYGFYGVKPLTQMTAPIRKDKAVKVPGTGNYLYRGRPLETYRQLRRDVGKRAVLTSGIRSVMKQFLLFFDKIRDADGNLSRASRSLAPPGYSFHGVGDFDVGQIGYGPDNFTERFVSTEVFHRLTDLGYVNLRYPNGNLLGVRFEPWHIKVGESA